MTCTSRMLIVEIDLVRFRISCICLDPNYTHVYLYTCDYKYMTTPMQSARQNQSLLPRLQPPGAGGDDGGGGGWSVIDRGHST